MKKLDYRDPNVGQELKRSSVVMLGFGFFSILISIYFANMMPKDGYICIIVGVAVAVLCVLLCLPNLRRFAVGKYREHMLKTGKLKEEATKSYDKTHKFGD